MSYRRMEANADVTGIPEIEPQPLPPEALSDERVQKELTTLFHDVTWQYRFLCKAQDKLVTSEPAIVSDGQGGALETSVFSPEGVALGGGGRLNIIREEERTFAPLNSGDLSIPPLATTISYTILKHTPEGEIETVTRLRGEFCNEKETPLRVWVTGDAMWGDDILINPEYGSLPVAPSKRAFLTELGRCYGVLYEIRDTLQQDPNFHTLDQDWPDGPIADRAFLNKLGIIDPELEDWFN